MQTTVPHRVAMHGFPMDRRVWYLLRLRLTLPDEHRPHLVLAVLSNLHRVRVQLLVHSVPNPGLDHLSRNVDGDVKLLLNKISVWDLPGHGAACPCGAQP